MKKTNAAKGMFTDEEMDSVLDKSKAMGLSVSELVRQSVLQYVGIEQVQNSSRTESIDPAIEWSEMCGRMTELNEMRKTCLRANQQLTQLSEKVNSLEEALQQVFTTLAKIQNRGL